MTSDYGAPRRLQPTQGAATGGRLTAPSSAAASRPAPVKKKSTVSRLLNLALSGETAYNFLSDSAGKIGVDVGKYEDAGGVTQFVADTFLSPVGLASAIAAPVTGGTSLGLKGAAGAAARIATRAGSELAVNAAANAGGKVVEEILPEGTPGWARAASVLAGAVVGGGAAASAIAKRSGVEAAKQSIEAGYVVAQGEKAAAGLKHMPLTAKFTDLVAETSSRQLPDTRVGNVLRVANEAVGASPFSNFKTRLGAITDAAEKQKVVNEGLPAVTLANAFPNGQTAFKEQGTLWQVGDGSFVPHQTVIADLDAVNKFKLTPEQAAVRQTYREIRDDGNALLRSRGIEIPDVKLGDGVDYWPHYSVANIDGDFRRAADRGSSRLYKSVEDGLANGVEYASANQTASAYMRNVLEEVRLRDIADEVASTVGVTVDQALLDTKLGRFAALRGAAATKKVARLREQIDKEMLRNKFSKGQASSELTRLRYEIRDLRSHETALNRALKVVSSTEMPAPRRKPTKGRSAELAAARGELKGEGRAAAAAASEPDDLIAAAAEYRKVVASGKMDEATAAALMAKRVQYSEQMRSGLDSADQLRTAIAEASTKRKALSEAAAQAKVKGGNVPMLEAKLKAAREKELAENKRWTDLREHTWDHLPGGMFGRGEENIPVALWNNKYYVPRDGDYAEFAKRYDGITGQAHNAALPKGLKAAEQASNLARFTAATADFAGAFTQGMALLAFAPKEWGKMAATSFQSFFDPAVQGRYIQKNWDSIQSMLVEGRVPGGEIEIFKAIEKDGLARFLKEAPVLGGGLTRFQRSYDTMLMVTRHQLWEALLPVWKGEKSALGDEIKKMTGGLDPRSIGVGPSRQAIESMVFFAPRMLRSTLALTADAMRPWTKEGELAARALTRITAGMAGVMMLANLSVGALNGEDDTQIEKRLASTMDPTSGRKFLSMQVGDHYYGVGGQVRGIVQLLSKAVSEPSSLTKADAMDNPLIRYAQGRLSPAGNTGLGIAELITDEDHNILPFNTVDTFPDLVKMTASSALPFALQSAAEEGWDWRNPATYAHPFVTAATEMGGIRATQFTAMDILDKSAYERYGLPYGDLTDAEQKVVEGLAPEAQKARGELGDKNDKEYRKAKDKADGVAELSLNTLQQKLSTGEMTPRDYREARQQVLRDRSVKLVTAQEDFDQNFGGTDTDKRKLMTDYFDTFDKAEFIPGQIDWERWEELQRDFDANVAAGKYGPVERARQMLDERRGFDVPADDWFQANAKVIRDVDYWGLKDEAFPKVAAAAARIDPNIRSANDLTEAISLAAVDGDSKKAVRLGAILHALEGITDARRKALRLKNPTLDKALFENGYITKRVTK